MTTAPQAFGRIDHHAGRLEAFADAVQHYPGVIGVSVEYDADGVEVVFEGHKSGVPMPIRDMAKALCLELPAPGSQNFPDSDAVLFQSNYNRTTTKVAFYLGDAIARNQR